MAGAAARPQFHRAALERAGITSGRLRDHPARKIDPALYGVLLALHGRGMPGPRSLALRLGLHSSTLCHHLARLEQRGLIERQRYWADRRLVAPILTPEGSDAFATLQWARLTLLDELTAPWSDDDLKALTTLMGRFAAALRVFNSPRQRLEDPRLQEGRRQE